MVKAQAQSTCSHPCHSTTQDEGLFGKHSAPWESHLAKTHTKEKNACYCAKAKRGRRCPEPGVEVDLCDRLGGGVTVDCKTLACSNEPSLVFFISAFESPPRFSIVLPIYLSTVSTYIVDNINYYAVRILHNRLRILVTWSEVNHEDTNFASPKGAYYAANQHTGYSTTSQIRSSIL